MTRLVVLGAPRLENLGAPLPDPKEQNVNVGLYNEAIRAMARIMNGFPGNSIGDAFNNWPQSPTARGASAAHRARRCLRRGLRCSLLFAALWIRHSGHQMLRVSGCCA